MIVCDRCWEEQVYTDGDLCEGCKEILRDRTVLDYLKDYYEEMESDYRLAVSEEYMKGLKGHIIRLEAQETGSRHCGQC